jgi:phage protein D
MSASSVQIDDGLDTLKDRFVPRYEVFVAKPVLSRDPPTPVTDLTPVDPDQATDDERARLDSEIFKETGAVGAPPPKISQLVALAGPFGDKPDQHTDDILSVEFTESIEKQQLARVSIEVLNVYDFVRQFYRYTDIPPNVSADQAGSFPIIDYGDTLALRFGYGADVQWFFEGIVTTVEASFPADGESVVTVTAVDKRDRMRGQKKVDVKAAANASVEQVIAQIAGLAGLQLAAPDKQSTPSDSSANRRPADQDALQYITDRASKAALELLCFGNTLYALKPADGASHAIRYVYRAGLTSFKPTFNGVGTPTAVHIVSRDPNTGDPVDVTVTTQDLQDLGLIPASSDDSATDTVAKAGQAGDKTEVVTNYRAVSENEARRLAAGILKRNIDAIITAEGEVIGDPRIRPRVTLRIEGVGRYTGFYYVTSATHRLGPNGYQTTFTARRTTALAAEGSASAPDAGADQGGGG